MRSTDGGTNGAGGTWAPGTHILWRYLAGDRVLDVRPVTVVADTSELLAVWLAGGTPRIRPVGPDGSEIRRIPLEQRFRVPRSTRHCTWFGTGILKLAPKGAAHSVWLFWDANGLQRGWYVNLETPHRRWHGGVDTTDHVLDIWVTPDRNWMWKDEDEFAAAIEAGRFTEAEAAAIRAEGERVIGTIRAWGAPFRDGWENFRPEHDWPLPTLPADWSDHTLS